MTLARWTLSFLRPYQTRVVAIGALSCAEIGLAALAPWPLKVIVDNVLGGRQLPDTLAAFARTTIGESVAALLVVVVVGGLLIQVVNELVRITHTQLQVDTAQRIVYKASRRPTHPSANTPAWSPPTDKDRRFCVSARRRRPLRG